jgi:hypothetical protein
MLRLFRPLEELIGHSTLTAGASYLDVSFSYMQTFCSELISSPFVEPDISIALVSEIPPLWSSDQSSWIQIRRPGFDSRHYQKKKVMGLERGPISLVSTTEELLDRKVAAPVYKTENMTVGISHADHVAPSISKKLAITSPKNGGRSVGIVRSQTQAMEFVSVMVSE